MNRKPFRPALVLVLGSVVLLSLMLVLSLPSTPAQASPPIPSGTVVQDAPADGSPDALLEFDSVPGVGNAAALPVALPDACVAPIVQAGSIITGVNLLMNGRLIRNGVPAVCGLDYSCAGTQSTGTQFSYESFNFINPTPEWQCVQVTLDARSCNQQVYSAAYLNSFNPANLCANNQGAMGFSTAGVYGYSFMVPPSTDFTIVNNTTGVVDPSASCANYVMTTTLCTTDLAVTATKRPQADLIRADSTGKAVVPVDVVFQNNGGYSAAVSAALVSETVSIQVQDAKPAVVQATFGHAGAIVRPGGTATQTVQLEFSGSQYQCLSRSYEVRSKLEMTAGVYACDGFNPPSAYVYVGSVLPDDNFDEDTVAFQSLPGTHITATVDTVSLATAFDIEACISGTPQGPCLAGFQGDDDFACTFAPPAFGCPRFGGLLPADPDNDDVYYLRINSGSGASNFAGPTGDYRASILVTEGPTGACPLVPVLDNGANSFRSLAGALAEPLAFESQVLTTTFLADVSPIRIIVPPSDPTNPSCDQVYLPVTLR
jgi:hypothetical protein